VGFVFASVLPILLVAAEFSWRTARQNVIDGLSKTQWYVAKLLLVPVLAGLFLLTRVGLGGGLALAGTGWPPPHGVLAAPQLRALGGLFLAGLGYGSLALFAAAAIRASGPAVAAWFAWFAFGERLLAGGVASLFAGLRPAVKWLPVATFGKLTDYLQYDNAALREAAAGAAAGDRPPPDLPPLEPALLGTCLWIAALLLIGWLWYRRRDL